MENSPNGIRYNDSPFPLTIEGQGRDSNPGRGIHSPLGWPDYPTLATKGLVMLEGEYDEGIVFWRHHWQNWSPGNSKNLNAMNFNKMPFTGNEGNCAKYRWATSCNVTWDGITSGVKNPCTKSS